MVKPSHLVGLPPNYMKLVPLSNERGTNGHRQGIV